MQEGHKRFTELSVWIEARKLVAEIYALTKNFPKDELFGLINQIRRCSVSIPSNIAEGCGRSSTKDSLHFFYIARGSLYELETQIYLSSDLGYLTEEQRNELLRSIEHTRKLLSGFINYYNSLTSKTDN